MSNDKIPPYPPDVEQLLEAEQVRPGLPSALKERMFGGIAATLGLPTRGTRRSGRRRVRRPGGRGRRRYGRRTRQRATCSAPPAGAGLDQAAASVAGPATTSIASGGAVAGVSAAKGAGCLRSWPNQPSSWPSRSGPPQAASPPTWRSVRRSSRLRRPVSRPGRPGRLLAPLCVPANPTKPAEPEPAVTAALDPSVLAPAAPRSRRASPLIAKSHGPWPPRRASPPPSLPSAT